MGNSAVRLYELSYGYQTALCGKHAAKAGVAAQPAPATTEACASCGSGWRDAPSDDENLIEVELRSGESE